MRQCGHHWGTSNISEVQKLTAEAMEPDRKHTGNDRESAEEERVRNRQNFVAGAFVVVLLVACWWLLSEWDSYQRLERCMEAGRRNCVTLDVSQPPAQQ